MNDVKYIGPNIHQANDLRGRSGFRRQVSDGSYPRNVRDLGPEGRNTESAEKIFQAGHLTVRTRYRRE
jgi:hypothetical protein